MVPGTRNWKKWDFGRYSCAFSWAFPSTRPLICSRDLCGVCVCVARLKNRVLTYRKKERKRIMKQDYPQARLLFSEKFTECIFFFTLAYLEPNLDNYILRSFPKCRGKHSSLPLRFTAVRNKEPVTHREKKCSTQCNFSRLFSILGKWLQIPALIIEKNKSQKELGERGQRNGALTEEGGDAWVCCLWELREANSAERSDHFPLGSIAEAKGMDSPSVIATTWWSPEFLAAT